MLIILLRTVLLYLLIVFTLRLMGKKQIGELQPSEFVTTIMISNIATLSLEDSSMPMLTGVVPILMIACLDVLVSCIVLKSNKIRRIVSGSPKVIVSNGTIDQNEMKNLRYTIDDLIESMREQQIFDISQVQYAIVETTGKISFFQKPSPELNPPEIIIKDGELNLDGLNRVNLTEKWVRSILLDHNIQLSRVFLMMSDSNGAYTLVPKTIK